MGDGVRPSSPRHFVMSSFTSSPPPLPLTGSLPVRLQGAGCPDGGVLHRLSQLLLLLSLLLGNVLLLQLTVLQFVLQLHATRLQQAAERRPTLLRPRLEGGEGGGRKGEKEVGGGVRKREG